jgi:hypothetical protein
VVSPIKPELPPRRSTTQQERGEQKEERIKAWVTDVSSDDPLVITGNEIPSNTSESDLDSLRREVTVRRAQAPNQESVNLQSSTNNEGRLPV